MPFFFPRPVLYGERVASALEREPGEGLVRSPSPGSLSRSDLSPHCGERESKQLIRRARHIYSLPRAERRRAMRAARAKVRGRGAPKSATARSPAFRQGARLAIGALASRRSTRGFSVPGTVTSVCATEDGVPLHPADFSAFVRTRPAIQGGRSSCRRTVTRGLPVPRLQAATAGATPPPRRQCPAERPSLWRR
jgi:hypothetical protein